MLKGKFYLGVVILGLLTFIMTACARETYEFEDIKWVLDSYQEQENSYEVLEGTRTTAIFESAEHKVSGSAGCNSYFGEYEVSAEDLTIFQLAHTEMACLEPEGVMEQESEYLKALQNASHYEIVDGKLRIFSKWYVLLFSVE